MRNPDTRWQWSSLWTCTFNPARSSPRQSRRVALRAKVGVGEAVGGSSSIGSAIAPPDAQPVSIPVARPAIRRCTPIFCIVVNIPDTALPRITPSVAVLPVVVESKSRMVAGIATGKWIVEQPGAHYSRKAAEEREADSSICK